MTQNARVLWALPVTSSGHPASDVWHAFGPPHSLPAFRGARHALEGKSACGQRMDRLGQFQATEPTAAQGESCYYCKLTLGTV